MKHLLVFLVMSTSVVAQAVSLPAMAQTASSAAAGGACSRAYNLPDKLPDPQVSDFKSNPQGLLKSNPVGGLQLSGEVKGLTETDPSAAVDALLEVARSANSTQAAAIGSGLGQAVKAILAVDKLCGDDIARRIAGSGLGDLLTGYNMATADTPMLFAGAADGAGGTGGGLGGVVNGTSGGSSVGATTSASGSISHANTAETFSFSGATITCSKSVSPRRTC
ncbi:hypothetical protein [Rhizobium sp. SG570]|uniref:hypothetical protein n=1 Tax=Rhizobium sp. SG570 TaxID=2587113 RepID=UPI001445991C|nr:hypothetical protein [Rhizobium sp. SG570]NKJ40310.1 hypothetical protein [Rhizobium sp. SG570]